MTDKRHSEQSISHHKYFRYSHGTIIEKRPDTVECRHRDVKAIEIERLFGHHANAIHTHGQQEQTLINSRPNSLFKSTEFLQTAERVYRIDSKRTEPNDS